MSIETIVLIVVAVIVVTALAFGATALMRRRRLQQRFGTEYVRLVVASDSKLKAEAELTERKKRVQHLDIRPLEAAARSGYAEQWSRIQEQFVDTPSVAVAAAQVLVTAVTKERGYPTEHHDQVLADLSVEHSNTLAHYRAADELSANAAAGKASTEDLRQAMIHYRAMFRDLLGESAAEDSGPAAADGTAAFGAAPHLNGSKAQELTK